MISRYSIYRLIGLAAALGLGMPAYIQAESGSPVTASTPGAERLRAELHVVLLRLIESGAFGGTAPEQIALTLTEPAQRYANVGLLVDPSGGAAGARGVRVVGTTPGGSAEQLGVKAGDQVLKVNGVDLVGNEPALAPKALKQTIDRLGAGDTLELTVLRDGSEQRLSGPLQTVFVPALRVELGDPLLLAAAEEMTPMATSTGSAAVSVSTAGSDAGCGRISAFHVAPRSRDLYAAKVMSIDGKIPGPQDQTTFRVSVGAHRVVVAEHIDDREIATANSRARRNKTKELTINVAADTTYLLAARLNEEQRNSVADGAYWDPLVWKEKAESCSR